MLVTKLTAIADAIRGKTGKTDGLTLDQMAAEIAGIEAGGGGSGGIGAVKFLDVDITVDASTTTKVDYVVDGLEIVSSAENPASTGVAFSTKDAYVAFVTPKNITGTPSGTFTRIYRKGIWIGYGNTNYTPTVVNILFDGTGVSAQNYGIYQLQLLCTSVKNGKKTGKLTASVRHHSSSGYEVVAGTYNIQMYYLDWKWEV
jgi:hypothetical protein